MVWTGIETRLVLAGVFGLSAAGKLHSAAAFSAYQEAVAQLGRVSKRYAKASSVILVAAEVLLAVGVLIGATSPAALVLITLLLAVFTFVLARAIRTRVDVTCACFGPTGRPITGSSLARNAALIGVALVALGARLAQPAELTDIGAGGLLVGLLGAVVAAGVFALWDDLADLLRPGPAASR